MTYLRLAISVARLLYYGIFARSVAIRLTAPLNKHKSRCNANRPLCSMTTALELSDFCCTDTGPFVCKHCRSIPTLSISIAVRDLPWLARLRCSIICIVYGGGGFPIIIPIIILLLWRYYTITNIYHIPRLHSSL